jgi:transcriptional pleiotropic regulator of transition state genes
MLKAASKASACCLAQLGLRIMLEDSLEIYVDGEKIILKKYEPACIFCGNADGIRIFKDKNICKDCFDLMKSVG